MGILCAVVFYFFFFYYFDVPESCFFFELGQRPGCLHRFFLGVGGGVFRVFYLDPFLFSDIST